MSSSAYYLFLASLFIRAAIVIAVIPVPASLFDYYVLSIAYRLEAESYKSTV